MTDGDMQKHKKMNNLRVNRVKKYIYETHSFLSHNISNFHSPLINNHSTATAIL